MGSRPSYAVTQEAPANENTYITSQCLLSCVEKCYKEGKEPCTAYALRHSTIFNKAVILYCGSSDEHPLFQNKDMLGFITYLLIECTVRERIIESEELYHSWSVSNRLNDGIHRITPPLVCSIVAKLSPLMIFENAGETYSVIRYFWLDDFYYSRLCTCSLAVERQLKEKEAATEVLRARRLNYLAYQRKKEPIVYYYKKITER